MCHDTNKIIKMYGRKQSTAGIDPGAMNLMQSAGGLGGAPGGPLGLDYGVDEPHGEGSEVIWSSRNGPRKLLRFLSLLRYVVSYLEYDELEI